MSFDNFKSSGPLKMSVEQARDIFRKTIIPSIGAKGDPPKKPALIVVAGQPGSGKSTTIRQAELGLSGATQKIIGDDFLAYVPGYYELAKTNPSTAAFYAHQAGSSYFDQETDNRAMDMKANIVLELARPKPCAGYGKYYRSKGYLTELHVVATPFYQSWTGVLDRAEKAMNDGHIGTNVLCPKSACEELYAGWPRAVFEAEEHKQYDRILIKRRDGTVVYDNHLVRKTDGTKAWKRPVRGVEALLKERHRAVSLENAKWAETTWDRIVKSRHMQTDEELRSLPLNYYRREVVDFVESDWNRFDESTNVPGKFSRETLSKWIDTILEDLSRTRYSREQFGHSNDFDKRTIAYGNDLKEIADRYIKLPARSPDRTIPLQQAGRQAMVRPPIAVQKRRAEEEPQAPPPVKRLNRNPAPDAGTPRRNHRILSKAAPAAKPARAASEDLLSDFSEGEWQEINRKMADLEGAAKVGQPASAAKPAQTTSEDLFSDFSDSEWQEIVRKTEALEGLEEPAPAVNVPRSSSEEAFSDFSRSEVLEIDKMMERYEGKQQQPNTGVPSHRKPGRTGAQLDERDRSSGRKGF